jgi:hypothetical protein
MWKIKLLIQFVLSHIPGGETINYFMQRALGHHNEQNNIRRIIELSKKIKQIENYVQLEGSTVVEVGTGWEPISTLLFYLLGANTIHTYDHVRHVRFGLVHTLLNNIEKTLEKIAEVTSLPKNVLQERLMKIKTNGEGDCVDVVFSRANVVYHAPGDATKTGLKDNSVDLIYSYAVLEHVPRKVLYDLTIESKRILKHSGCAFHAIGLFDHYVTIDKKISKVNFLKYRERVWSFFVHNKISYHNRLREKQFLDVFDLCGAQSRIMENKTDPLDIATVKNMKIDGMFAGLSSEELAVHYTELIVSFPRQRA